MHLVSEEAACSAVWRQARGPGSPSQSALQAQRGEARPAPCPHPCATRTPRRCLVLWMSAWSDRQQQQYHKRHQDWKPTLHLPRGKGRADAEVLIHAMVGGCKIGLSHG